MDNHLKKCAAQINVCLECNIAVEELLAEPGEDGESGPLATRGSWQYHVCALPYNGENKDTLMIAARISTFSGLEPLHAEK